MSRRSFPDIQAWGTLDKEHGGVLISSAGKECTACDKPATHWVRIAYSFMRGDDEVEHVCQRHHQMARETMRRFMAHVATKGRFIASKEKETEHD